MSMTEVVEESLKADPRFRHLTVMPVVEEFHKHQICEILNDGFCNMIFNDCNFGMDWK